MINNKVLNKSKFILLILLFLGQQAKPDQLIIKRHVMADVEKVCAGIGLVLFVYYTSKLIINKYPDLFKTSKSNSKSNTAESDNNKIIEGFDSVAGADEAKKALGNIVSYLKDPAGYTRLGAKGPKGVLLVGEPGNGKTMLARALAGEAGCAFYAVSGSELTSVFVGLGAYKVRELFEKACESAPAIIFIDEIDAIGASRNNGASNDEHTKTLTQLLACMDGFNKADKPVIVVAATNKLELLDKALIRPGRFDTIVNVPNPNLKARIELLQKYTHKLALDANVDLTKIARGTPGFSGAELSNMINEAILVATKAGKELIDMQAFEEARDKVMMGSTSKTMMLTEKDRQITAFHEAGHALITLMLPDNLDPLHKVTITPRGGALGLTWSLSEREKYNSTKIEMLARITMALGGRVAEELIFAQITTGAYSDFVTATNIARKMVCAYGMSDDVGMAVYSQNYGEYQYSQKTAEQIDAAVTKIVSDCYQRAKDIILENRDKLDKLASALLEKETLYASEIYELLGIEPRGNLKLVD